MIQSNMMQIAAGHSASLITRAPKYSNWVGPSASWTPATTKSSLISAPISGYILVDTPNTVTCDFITTSSECEAAAQDLGLPDTSATPSPVRDTDSWGDPPYCYIEDDSLKFNSDGSNTGKCGDAYNNDPQYHDKCLCKSTSTMVTTTSQTGNKVMFVENCGTCGPEWQTM